MKYGDLYNEPIYLELTKWCQKYNIEEKSINNFYEQFKDFEKENPSEYKQYFKYGVGKLKPRISKISYAALEDNEDGGFVYVYVDMMDDGEYKGYIKLEYRYGDGTYFDEFFVLKDL